MTLSVTSGIGTLRSVLVVASLLATAGCSRSRPGAVAPGATPTLLDAASARASLSRRAQAVAKNAAAPGIAAERCPLLLAPDEGAPVAGTLEEGTAVDVVLVEPGFYGVRTGDVELAFVPARSIRLGPGPLEGTPVPRPRREIVPQIIPLTPPPGEAATPPPGAPSIPPPVAAVPAR
ncbi:MAG: hypothetical protein ACHQPI_12060 [Thermoanaerobaculia bacterium]